MATKTVKKARPTTAKKTTVKKTATRKPVATTAATHEMHACPCGANCPCHNGGACQCQSGASCHCGAGCKCGGSRFGRFVKKLIVFLIIFALGFATAKFCCCHGKKPHFGFNNGPRVHFVNGCVDMSSVKCPKLAAALPAMDINGDGCITREEYRAVKKQMRREIREMKVQEEVTESVTE